MSLLPHKITRFLGISHFSFFLFKPETAAALKRTVEALMERGAIVRNLENLGERSLPYKISKHRERHKRGGYVVMPFPPILSVLLPENGHQEQPFGLPHAFWGCRWDLGGLSKVVWGLWGVCVLLWSVLCVLFWVLSGLCWFSACPRPAGLSPT